MTSSANSVPVGTSGASTAANSSHSITSGFAAHLYSQQPSHQMQHTQQTRQPLLRPTHQSHENLLAPRQVGPRTPQFPLHPQQPPLNFPGQQSFSPTAQQGWSGQPNNCVPTLSNVPKQPSSARAGQSPLPVFSERSAFIPPPRPGNVPLAPPPTHPPASAPHTVHNSHAHVPNLQPQSGPNINSQPVQHQNVTFQTPAADKNVNNGTMSSHNSIMQSTGTRSPHMQTMPAQHPTQLSPLPGVPPSNVASPLVPPIFRPAMPPRSASHGTVYQPPTPSPMPGSMPVDTGSQLNPLPRSASMQNGVHTPPQRSSLAHRYPQMPVSGSVTASACGPVNSGLAGQMERMSVLDGARANVLASGFNGLWGTESVDLLKMRHILPPTPLQPPKVVLPNDHLKRENCAPEVMRCTLTKVPESSSILQKCRLPFGLVLQPFADKTYLPVIQCRRIVRCRSCRAYINPFVYFIDQNRWKCNVCYRANDLPEEFLYDPTSKVYGDPSRRPECKSATIEFIAPAEYLQRPPQPACYLFVLDVSHAALETGYLRVFCETLLLELDNMPKDSRALIGFITYDKSVHFYNMLEGCAVPEMLIVSDVDDVFLPLPEGLLVNLAESHDLVTDLLVHLPEMFTSGDSCENSTTAGGGGVPAQRTIDANCTHSAYGAALTAAYKLAGPVGGRVTSFVVSLPSFGPGSLSSREDPNDRAGGDVSHLSPATDFYKRLSLDCMSKHLAIDIFCLANSYIDLASLAGVSQFTGASVYQFLGVHHQHNPAQMEAFREALVRHLTRRIGFEAVFRVRCSTGMSMHTFHGNSFVRSHDLLVLSNVSPDAGFGIQVAIDEPLSTTHVVCFQASLLYTTHNGERRIRVHTLSLPVSPNMHEVIHAADQEAIVSLLAKMVVDRCLNSSLLDARTALTNSVVDVLDAYRATLSSPSLSGLEAPLSLRLLPLFVLALLKHPAFRCGTSTKLDERTFALLQMKNLPLRLLMKSVYPDLYAIHALTDEGGLVENDIVIPQPARLHLSAESIDRAAIYLLDTATNIYIMIGSRVADACIQAMFGVPTLQQMPMENFEVPELETEENLRLRKFLLYLQSTRPSSSAVYIIREESKYRQRVFERLIEDRSDSTYSYIEYLQHIRSRVK